MNSELPESVICMMFRGSGPGCVHNSNSEHLRGTIHRKLKGMEAISNFVGCLAHIESSESSIGFECVQKSKFEHLRGTKYRKIRRMEANNPPNVSAPMANKDVVGQVVALYALAIIQQNQSGIRLSDQHRLDCEVYACHILHAIQRLAMSIESSVVHIHCNAIRGHGTFSESAHRKLRPF